MRELEGFTFPQWHWIPFWLPNSAKFRKHDLQVSANFCHKYHFLLEASFDLLLFPKPENNPQVLWYFLFLSEIMIIYSVTLYAYWPEISLIVESGLIRP